LFLLLREELKDEDIPHRTTIRNHIFQVWDRHLEQLENEMQVRVMKTISQYEMIDSHIELRWQGVIYNRHVV
jgi:hypothetical protein